jgi:hypothetical protein
MPTQFTRRSLLAACGVSAASSAFAQRQEQTPARWTYSIATFENGSTDGWLPGFSDFSPATASTNRIAEVRRLPSVISGGGQFGYYLQGRNTSDDLFMFLKKPVTGLAAGRSYRISFYVELASNAPSNCVGIGGAPGEAVTLKAGAATREPLAILQNDDVRLNVDKGNQSGGGANAVLLGNIANGLPCESAGGRYVLLTRSGSLNSQIQTDLSGTLWIFAGTDSGFEGTTGVYYAFIAALLTLVE